MSDPAPNFKHQDTQPWYKNYSGCHFCDWHASSRRYRLYLVCILLLPNP